RLREECADAGKRGGIQDAPVSAFHEAAEQILPECLGVRDLARNAGERADTGQQRIKRSVMAKAGRVREIDVRKLEADDQWARRIKATSKQAQAAGDSRALWG